MLHYVCCGFNNEFIVYTNFCACTNKITLPLFSHELTFTFFHNGRCYCILHDENVLGAVFSIWDDLKVADSWEEVELTVFGELNNYKGFP